MVGVGLSFEYAFEATLESAVSIIAFLRTVEASVLQTIHGSYRRAI
jgi:hypothetical protein